MGRVLSPFSKVIRPERIELAQKEPFGGSLKEVIESPVTDIAVQGISRLADLLNYRDRLGDEKQRQEAAQATQQALEQQRAQIGEIRGMSPGQIESELEHYRDFGDPTNEREKLLWLAQAGAQAQAPSGVPAAFGGGPNRQIQQALEGTDLGQLNPQELQSLLQRVSGRPGGISGGTWQEGTLRPGMEGYEDLVLLQQGIDPLIDPSVYRGEVEREGEEAHSGRRTRLLIKKLRPYADALEKLYAAKGSPEAQTPERQALLDGKIAEIEAAMAALAPQLEERFVPRDLADFRMVAKDLQGRILAAESEEEREVLRDQLRETVRTARSATDMPSTSLSEAFGGVKGREAQEVVVEDIDAAREAYAKQMKEEARLKREEERDARAIESHAMKVARFDERKRKKANDSRKRRTSGVKLSSKGKLLADAVEEYSAGMTWEGGTWGDNPGVVPSKVATIIKKEEADGNITRADAKAIGKMLDDANKTLAQEQSRRRIVLSGESGQRAGEGLGLRKESGKRAKEAAKFRKDRYVAATFDKKTQRAVAHHMTSVIKSPTKLQQLRTRIRVIEGWVADYEAYVESAEDRDVVAMSAADLAIQLDESIKTMRAHDAAVAAIDNLTNIDVSPEEGLVVPPGYSATEVR